MTGILLAVASGVFAQGIKEARVMTYNIRYKNSIDSINSWEFRKDNVASLIKYHQADIIGVQEAFLTQIHDLVDRLPGYKWCGVARVTGPSAEYAAIFYRADKYRLIDSGTFWFSETPYIKETKSWDAMYPRVASWCKFRELKTGVVFYHFNTHLDHVGEIARQHSAEILNQQIDSIAKKMPVLLTGDFNSVPTSVSYKKIIDHASLKDALIITKTPHYGPENTSSGFTVSARPIRGRIDYVFVNDKVEVLQHVTITDQTEGRYYSDHLPVLTVLNIKK